MGVKSDPLWKAVVIHCIYLTTRRGPLNTAQNYVALSREILGSEAKLGVWLGKIWLWKYLNLVIDLGKFWASDDVGCTIQVKFEGGSDQVEGFYTGHIQLTGCLRP